MRQALAALLRSSGRFSVTAECGSAAETRSACQPNAPDLVIIDTRFSDGTGIDLLRDLVPQFPVTRFLLVSDDTRSTLVANAVDCGAHGMVMASQPASILLEALQALARGQNFYCSASSRLLIDRLWQSRVASSGTALTTRERQVLTALAEGKSVKVMAGDFGLSTKTVSNHLSLLKEKLGVHEPVELLRYAIRHGLVELAS